MNILWFTTRSMSDLCATTVDALGNGLVSLGHNVTLVNPDVKGSHSEFEWKHVAIPIQAIRGRKGYTLGKKMRMWLTHLTPEKKTVAIVDWRIASALSSTLQAKSIPWILLDRSPPADRGILARLQWPVWKKAWNLVKSSSANAGCVVSITHAKFVHSKIGIQTNKLVQLPAGVDVELFRPGIRNEILTLIYHGRLDKNRGVLSLPMLQQKLEQQDVQTKLILIGEGDASIGLDRISKEKKQVEVHASLPQEELAKILATAHIGLLPMPKTEVWSLASPLKRSEYSACGLLIFGIDHLGHRFNHDVQPDWIQLVPQEDFHIDGTKWIKALDEEKILTLSHESRLYATEHLRWSTSVETLEKACLSCLN